MARSTYVPWWDEPGITRVVVTPARLQAYGQRALGGTPVHAGHTSDPHACRPGPGAYVQALIHRYTKALIAGDEPDVDEVLARAPLPVMVGEGGDDEEHLLGVGRAHLIGYRRFLQDQAYGIVVSTGQYVRTPGRRVAGIPGVAVFLGGRLGVIAVPGSAGGRHGQPSHTPHGDWDVRHIDCIAIRTTSIVADVATQPSSYIYDQLVRFAYGTACHVSLVHVVPATGQMARACLTDDHSEVGAAMCRSLISSIIGKTAMYARGRGVAAACVAANDPDRTPRLDAVQLCITYVHCINELCMLH